MTRVIEARERRVAAHDILSYRDIYLFRSCPSSRWSTKRNPCAPSLGNDNVVCDESWRDDGVDACQKDLSLNSQPATSTVLLGLQLVG